MLYSLPSFVERLLTALADQRMNNNGFQNLADVTHSADLEWMSGWIDYAIVRLENSGHIETRRPASYSIDDEEEVLGRITNKGLDYLNSKTPNQAVPNLLGITSTEFPETPIDWVILCSLLISIDTANRGHFLTISEIKENIFRNAEEGFVRERLDFLIQSGYVRKVHALSRGSRGETFELTAQGIWFTIQHTPTIFDFAQWPHADQPPEEAYDLLESIREWDSAIHEQSEPHQHSSFEVPASDRSVSLNHNNPDYKEAGEKLDKATSAIRGFNGTVEYDKELIVSELDAAKALLNSTKVRVGAIAILALEPLYIAYKDVGAEALRPIIKAAIDALKVLLGVT